MTAQRPERPIACDASALAADAESVDALARLQLHARRHGYELRLCEVTSELRGLLELCGLGDVLRLEVVRQTEEGEERRGVEEERDVGDPPT
jgi:anti-anti-sigma regulatory factor